MGARDKHSARMRPSRSLTCAPLAGRQPLPPRVTRVAGFLFAHAFEPAEAPGTARSAANVARALPKLVFADSFLTDAVMPIGLDKYLGVHAQALNLRSQRTELLAANIANADTPGYRARDIDFKSALAQAVAPPAPPRGAPADHEAETYRPDDSLTARRRLN